MLPSLVYASINSHGQLGYFNTPSAFNFLEPSFNISIYRGHPERKIILTASPFNWLDASIFYADLTNRQYPASGYRQSYKDKGYSFKVTLKEKNDTPAIAIGANDISGTGFFSSEYMVLSDYNPSFEYSLGIGWGTYSEGITFKNPFSLISDRFSNRTSGYLGQSGTLEYNRYFTGKKASLFGGIKYNLTRNLKGILEYDPTTVPGNIRYKKNKSRISFGLEYLTDNYSVSFGLIRGRDLNLQFNLTRNFANFGNKPKLRSSQPINNWNELQKEFARNDIGLLSAQESDDLIELDVRHNAYENQYIVNEYVYLQSKALHDEKDIKINHSKLGMNLLSVTYPPKGRLNFRDESYSSDQEDKESKNVRYRLKDSFPVINNTLRPTIKNYFAAREGFVFTGIMLEDSLEIVLKENLVFLANFKYSIKDDFDGLFLPPIDKFAYQVRSDNKKYFNNLSKRIVIGRFELNHFASFQRKHFVRISSGIYEDMFGGAGIDYVYYPEGSIFSFGLEHYQVKKRDYGMRFKFKEYSNSLNRASINILEPNTNINFNLSFGEYLAKDEGYTFHATKRFDNGIKFSVFFTRTNVSKKEYGEGSFDKGIKISIPLSLRNNKNLSHYEWRPLTKDPGALLIKSVNLFEEIYRFRIY